MKMSYKKIDISDLENKLNSFLPGSEEFSVEFSHHGDSPTIVYNEKMRSQSILKLVKRYGFSLNDICGIKSNGEIKQCIGITLNKPFIHDKTKELIEGLFIVGNPFEENEKNYLYSFLIKVIKPDFKPILFSVDITSENVQSAKSIFYKKVSSFIYSSKKNEMRFIPVTYENGEWVELEPEVDEGEIRFQIEHLTLDKVNELFIDEGMILL